MDARPPAFLPAHLYKFHSLAREFDEVIDENGVPRRKNGFDALEDVLLRGLIYYSKPFYFNDPFELEGVRTRLSARERRRITDHTIRIMNESGRYAVSPERLKRLVTEQSERDFAAIEAELDREKNGLLYRCGYISLSSSNDEKLMWTHYADAHRGICLRLKRVDDNFYSCNGAGRIIEVEYGDEIVEKEVEVGADNSAFLVQASRKATCWAYEREFRVFRLPSNRKADDAQGNHNFNSKLVDGVYFGLRTPEHHKERVKAIVAATGSHIPVFQAARERDRLHLVFEEVQN